MGSFTLSSSYILKIRKVHCKTTKFRSYTMILLHAMLDKVKIEKFATKIAKLDKQYVGQLGDYFREKAESMLRHYNEKGSDSSKVKKQATRCAILRDHGEILEGDPEFLEKIMDILEECGHKRPSS